MLLLHGNNFNGFKLISLELRENTLFGKNDIFFDFLESEPQDSIYTTVLIGVNGTGKSNLFRTIIELLKELNDLKNGKNRSYAVDGQFSIKYAINNRLFEYSNIRNVAKTNHTNATDGKLYAYLLIDGELADFSIAELPEAIVANSIMLTDKYPVYNNEAVFPIYKYLGIRNRPQNASTRSYVRKTVEFIVKEFDSQIFRDGLSKAVSFLGLGTSIDIFYYTSNTTTFFKGDLTPLKLDNYFKSIREKYASSTVTPPFKLQQYLKISEDRQLVSQLCKYTNHLFESGRLTRIERSSTKKINYNIIDVEELELLKNEFETLEHLRQLGMIYAPEIQLQREGGYSLQESSSGEYHFFSSVVGLMATVKPNSLVFIDEPEVSLHPNWQMQYLSFLRELFSGSEYAQSHILIATHSHFLISDLKAENSKIIGLKRESNKVEIVNLPENLDTYCWSADDVLYNIFNVPSTRNKFVADDLAKILDVLATGKDGEINQIDNETYNTLLHLRDSLKEDDPLKEVVKSILKKILV